jgi:DNA-binding FadR family transcriptional regulator
MRTHEQVLEAIEDQILKGHLRSGDRLPSERELAAMLGVSRPSVREALRVLEWIGVVVASVGSGRDAGSMITGSPSQALTRVLRVHLALANFSLDNLVSTRTLLEVAAVAEAAVNATDESVAQLHDILCRMDPSDPSLEAGTFNSLDTEFHVVVAEASGNPLLADLMQSLRDAVQIQMIQAFERLDDWRDTAAELTNEHLAIIQAIERGASDEASALVSKHIESFYRTGVAT